MIELNTIKRRFKLAELKEQALLERIGELTTSYENKIADLRVEITNVYAAYNELKGASDEVLEGEVVN